ncbi:MAG: DNA-3-methyladenine glycosylase 2 family protein [Clostridia bacterium]|nr:DNA-3-methyladenine glycosylase 2 family protein [Clostridia bacterium]
MDISFENDSILFRGVDCFDVGKSCACGQAFRWRPFGGGMLGVVRGEPALLVREDRAVRVVGASPASAAMWAHYLDIGRDYGAIERAVAADARLARCFPEAHGIRVFNQEPFEALISFIISQNNNIKRISGIIERLCAKCGEPVSFMGETLYAFPGPEAIAALTAEELAALGTGYRAPFIKAAAERILEGFDLERLRDMGLDEARAELRSFTGIGPKVADCILLFSLGHADAFPVDVWIDRAMKALFFEGNRVKKAELYDAVSSLGEYSGIIQQYIFQYARKVGSEGLEKRPAEGG